MLNINEILDRLKTRPGLDTDAALADELGVSTQRMNNWRGAERGTIPWAVLADFSEQRTISMDWMIFGREDYPVEGPSCPVNCDEEMRELCRQTKGVVESQTKYAGALRENIHAFYKAVQDEERHRIDIEGLREEGNRRINELMSSVQKTVQDAVREAKQEVTQDLTEKFKKELNKNNKFKGEIHPFTGGDCSATKDDTDPK